MPATSVNPPPLALRDLSDLMWDGLKLLEAKRTADACDRWLQAWELVKKLATQDMLAVRAFDHAYYHALPERVVKAKPKWNPDLAEQARPIRESQAREKLIELYLRSVGAVQAKQVDMLCGWGKTETQKAVEGP